MKKKIHIVLDEKEKTKNRQLNRMLVSDYQLIKNGYDGKIISQLMADRPDLIMVGMGKSSTDALSIYKQIKTHQDFEDIPVIFVASSFKLKDEVLALAAGAGDYISGPFKTKSVKARIENQIAMGRIHQSLRQNLTQKTTELIDSQFEIVQRLSKAAEHRDPETGDHIHRMSQYCYLLAKAYKMSSADCELMLHASPMHDIGKLGIPDSILLNPEKLTAKEWVIMKEHSTIGERILDGGRSKLLHVAKIVAGTHHERWNGKGYPRGLTKKNIPIWGRIAALADVFDAMTTKRVYQEPCSVDKALTYLKSEKGKRFDPELVDLFEKIFPEVLIVRKEFPL